MASTFELYQGRLLPDLTSPLLIVSITDHGKFSRGERFLIRGSTLDRSACHFIWDDGFGLEIQPRQTTQTLLDFEVAQAVKAIESEIRKKLESDPVAARNFIPFGFEKIVDAKSFLTTKRLMNELPVLDPIDGSRCVELRRLVEQISSIKPLQAKVETETWCD